MNIEVYAKPMFRLYITETLTESLMACGSLHYSPECKDAVRLGGFVFGWDAQFKAMKSLKDSDKWEPCITSDGRTLDICLKLMENPPLMPTAKLHEMNSFAALVRKALVDGQAKLAEFSYKIEAIPY